MLLTINGTCNSTLDDMRIGDSEAALISNYTFHDLGIVISAGCTLIAILLSFFLIFMHAIHYTKPYEQRHIIRILFMIPVYAASSFLSIYYYWHAVYFEVISECYEAFAIASFFALLCHYIAPDLHEQKAYFRGISPKPWVLPLNWFRACCCGDRGPWRIPRSGLTWFNVIWTGVYQYCFMRVTMMIVSVVTQYFGRYCESSNEPQFAHIWVLLLESLAVTIAMYCLIQFYIQLKDDLKAHSPLLKVAAIKLVIFLSFWQSFMISILTSSTLNIVEPTKYVAYPDLKIGIPSLLLCIEMALFSILHIFAFPYKPYTERAKQSEPSKYPSSPMSDQGPIFNELGPKQGGFLGIKALIDAMNPWDLVKGFARGMRWLFIGVRRREEDESYNKNLNDMVLPNGTHQRKATSDLPIAYEFRRSNFGMPMKPPQDEEVANLLNNAQPQPLYQRGSGAYVPARQRYDAQGNDITPENGQLKSPYPRDSQQIGVAISGMPDHQAYQSQVPLSQQYLHQKRYARQQRPLEPMPTHVEQSTPPATNTKEDELWGAASAKRDENNQF
ncbi:organic solute transporter Ostalpha-domain-containing protein [Calycina marina]|uniref:Organic solute transporter Ostalpha-domain-containing protein n=1 Tax=Calycina marina TaxID=1763456 RepID=A0A9P7Z331_9HELO|nr:organic solute transporter Ostalpha-domain-containing protein [Calycina marina]